VLAQGLSHKVGSRRAAQERPGTFDECRVLEGSGGREEMTKTTKKAWGVIGKAYKLGMVLFKRMGRTLGMK
jgi:hypothetical protein